MLGDVLEPVKLFQTGSESGLRVREGSVCKVAGNQWRVEMRLSDGVQVSVHDDYPD